MECTGARQVLCNPYDGMTCFQGLSLPVTPAGVPWAFTHRSILCGGHWLGQLAVALGRR